MTRRAFLNAMSMVPLTFLLPMSKPSEGDYHLLSSPSVSLSPEQQEALKKTALLEQKLRQQKGFSWSLHNDLRHYYGAFDESKSLKHADVILAHSIMDGYILNTLSDWHNVQNSPHRDLRQAVTSLLYRVEKHPTLRHLQAASVIKVGEICSEVGALTVAQNVYRRVMTELSTSRSHPLMSYRLIAEHQLEVLDIA